MARRKAKCWSFSTGERGGTVTVYEREPGGPLWARAFDRSSRGGKGGYVRVALRHRDQERAKTYAMEQAAKLRQGRADLLEGKVTLSRLLALYLEHRSPRKTAGEQRADQRKAEMWCRVLGPRKDPHLISLGEWERFIAARMSGTIDARGESVPTDRRRPLRARAVEENCKWLRWALNWAVHWREVDGRYLMRENPLRGFEMPVEENPNRPVATTDRYEALRAVSDGVLMDVSWDGGRQRSYLSELLDLAHGTGRRISAICGLRYEDLRPDDGPYGSIRWPAATDKEGRETVAPITPRVRAALDRILRERPGIGARYLFPSPANPAEPVREDRARRWLLNGEKLAGLPKQKGSLWHAYRRGWATARKHLSLKDTAAAGGWASTETLLNCYQQPDDATMLAVVMGGVELRGREAV